VDDDYLTRRQVNQEFWIDRIRRFGGASLRTTASTAWVRDATLRELRVVIRPGDRVLEVGCGNGNLLAPLAEYSRVFGIDLVMEMLQLARSHRPALHRLARSDVSQLPFRDESFDVVYSSRCLINVQSRAMQAAALDEMFRVVRRGGTVVISENFEEPMDRLNNARRRAGIPMQPRHRLTLLLNLAETLPMFAAKGWEVRRIRGFPMSYFFSEVVARWFADRRWGSVSHRLLSPLVHVTARADGLASAFLPAFGHDTTITMTRPMRP
jgi:SAM-dependent methyltransferase